MSKQTLTTAELESLAQEIRLSNKYKDLDLPLETIRDLILQEMPHYRQIKDVQQVVKKKLHNIVALYLGDPDYPTAQQEIRIAFDTGEDSVRECCLSLLSMHASTRERLPILANFYQHLWSICGAPTSILDLACGLHPFGLPWMQLPPDCSYTAYDLHHPRVDLLNTFFQLSGCQAQAVYQDILVSPPQTKADVAFFFKEAHRFEQRQHGCNRAFWLALPVQTLLVSLPTTSLTGRHDKAKQHRKLVYETLEGLDWPVTEIEFENELVFCITKRYE
jgi:16S rRNA (guanine(1405)-N(7))-methyltransferase